MTVPELGIEFYIYVLPVLVVFSGALLLMLAAVSRYLSHPSVIYLTLMAVLVGSLVSVIFFPQMDYRVFREAYVVDGLARFGQMLVLGLSLLICVLFRESHLGKKFLRGDVASIFLMTVGGMLVLVSSENLLSIFVGLEIFSLGTYALIGYINRSQPSQEAAIKYFVLGSFAAALLLFGFAFLYAGTGHLDLPSVFAQLGNLREGHLVLVQLGGVFVVVGVAFKLALVPCHLWTPDAYEGAPTALTAFMATIVKAVVVVLALRLFAGNVVGLTAEVWTPALVLFAGLSMIVGNILALAQNTLKRLLAYSSIAHGGYLTVALAVGGEASTVLYYVIAYSVISLGAFAIVIWLENEQRDNIQLDDLNGLARRHPFVCFALAVFMFAFAGIPPTVGFFAKFFVFSSALAGGFYWLVLIGVVGSAISFYYYLRIILRMYFVKEDVELGGLSFVGSRLTMSLIVCAVLLTLFAGLMVSRHQLRIFDVREEHVSYLN